MTRRDGSSTTAIDLVAKGFDKPADSDIGDVGHPDYPGHEDVARNLPRFIDEVYNARRLPRAGLPQPIQFEPKLRDRVETLLRLPRGDSKRRIILD